MKTPFLQFHRWPACFLSLLSAVFLLSPLAFAQSLPTVVTPIVNAVQINQPFEGTALIGGSPAPTTVTFANVPPGLTATHLGGGRVKLSGTPTGLGRVVNIAVTATNTAGTANLMLPIQLSQWTSVPRNLVSIGVGAAHTCVVIDGGVMCWGLNTHGQLGNGTTVSSFVPIQTIAFNSGATQVSSGPNYSCAVVAGGVKCWGGFMQIGGFALLGNGSTTGGTTPTQTIAAGSGVTQVATGLDHACAVLNAGAAGIAKCWGDNQFGEFGRGNTLDSLVPVDVSITGVRSIAIGKDFTCAVDGGARCWGKNDVGQLGDGTTVTRLVPTRVASTATVGGMTAGVTSIAAGNQHTCAVQNAEVFCWGLNFAGQLGDNQGHPGGTNIPVAGIVSNGAITVSAGGNKTCIAFTNFGPSVGLRCWGDNYAGGRQIIPGFVYTDAVTIPLLSVGASHTCATRNGRLQCFGASGAGQLGIGDITALTPIIIERFRNSPTEVIAITQVSAGFNHTCAVVNGAARCIGGNDSNQQFINSSVSTTQVATGKGFSCAIVDGGVKCIGANDLGQIGNTGSSSSIVPFQTVAANSGTTAIAAKESNGCAVVAGGVRCWGANGFGQLGNGTLVSASSAVQTIAAASGATAIAVGAAHACAVVNGGVRCWGNNNSGELGNGTTSRTGISTPVQTLPDGSGVTAIAAGAGFSCAVINGSVKCWGQNNNGQLGDTTTAAQSLPVTTIAAVPGTGAGAVVATNVAAGANHACAIVNGGLRCWGSNRVINNITSDAEGRERFGILGDGTRVDVSLTPLTVIADGSNVSSVSGGLSHTCATVNGSAVCWGDNSSDQLGLVGSSATYAAMPTNVRFDVSAGAGVPITVTADVGGTISPSGTVSVINGASQTFTITPNAGFILINPSGTCAGTLNGTVYRIASVTAPCTLNARFQPIPANHHVVTASIGIGEEFGQISPPQQSVLNGDPNSFAAIIAFPANTHAVELTTGGTCGAGATVTYASIGARVEFNTPRGRTSDCTVILNFKRGTTPQTVTFPQPANLPAGTSANLNVTSSSGAPVVIEVLPASSSICFVSLNALIAIAPGVCSMSAIQPGDTVFAPSARVDRNVTVTAAVIGSTPQTITFAALTDRALGSGTFSVAPTASSSLSVSVTSLTPSVCTIRFLTVVFLDAVGTCTLRAAQAGNATFAAAPNVDRSFNITAALSATAQTITFAALTDRALGSGSVNVAPTASSMLAVTVTSLTPTICTISGGVVSLAAVGVCTLRAAQAGNATFAAAANVDRSFNITAAVVVPPPPPPPTLLTQTITFGAIGNRVIGDAPFMLSAIGGASGLPVTFSASPASVCSTSGSNLTIAGAGECIVFANQAGNAQFSAAVTVIQRFNVMQRSVVTLRGGIDPFGDGRGRALIRGMSGAGAGQLLLGGFDSVLNRLIFTPMTDPGITSRVLGVGDITGSARSALLLQDAVTGMVSYWRGFDASTAQQLRIVKPGWTVESIADIDGDGYADIVWRFESTPANPSPADNGAVFVWFMKDGAIDAVISRGGAPMGWSIIGATDLHGAGRADLIWVSPVTTNPPTQIRSITALPNRGRVNELIGTVPVGYALTRTGDFTGSGKAALLFQNRGKLQLWVMDGITVQQRIELPDVDPAWEIFTTADLNGDGTLDIVFKKPDNTLVIWFMSSSVAGGVQVLDNAGSVPPGFANIDP